MSQIFPTVVVSLAENGATLDKTLTDIRDHYGYTAYGEGDWPKLAHLLTFSVKNLTIRQLLDICFKDQPLAYRLDGKTILISVRPVRDTWIHGFVLNERKEPIAGATILPEPGRSSDAGISAENGEYRVHIRFADTKLIFSDVNHETEERIPPDKQDLIVFLRETVAELPDASVTAPLHNGYQVVSDVTSTGSFARVGNELLNRRVSPNILDRMDGVTSSVLFNKNTVPGTNASAITIRGRSTIFSNPDPLIVVDNFPYTGDINNINPDDVESITVLKDAAAASIWGVFSGNGVIVITTKKGKYNQAPKITLNTSLTVGQKPNLNYKPIMSSGDFIDVESGLFDSGFYDALAGNSTHPALSPVVEILLRERAATITATDAQSQIDVLRGQDTRQDLSHYFYRPSLNQQYALSLSGGGIRNQYYFSSGFDKDLSNLVRNQYDRITLTGNNTYNLIPGKLELTNSLAFTSSTSKNNNSGSINAIYPYLKLADAGGNALPVTSQLRQGYADTVGGGQLLNWRYQPLDELKNADIGNRQTDYRINIGLQYVFRKNLNVNIFYQHGGGNIDFQNYQSNQSYYTRNLINEFSQPVSNGGFTFPIPRGGILDESINSYVANNVRGQLNFDDSSLLGGVLNANGGMELRDVEGQLRETRLYGYSKQEGGSASVDYADFFPQLSSGHSLPIPFLDQRNGTSERYLSYYINAAYNFRHRYIFSASFRRDESNLFGVNSNQRGVPLWSLGSAWEISREHFYHSSWLPFLRLRLTNGYTGNVDRSVSALTTANLNPDDNLYGVPTAAIVNPPNPSLRWERIHILNAGLEFTAKRDRLGGSLEYYIKSGNDLIGQSPLDPTTGALDPNTGIAQFIGNTANMRANGVDISLHTNLDIGPVRWNSTLLFSFVRDQVTQYKQQLGSVQNYLITSSINPLVGRPLYSVYSLRWEGLDPANGDPQGWLNGKITKDYNSIFNSSDLSNLVYKGPVNPPFFGSWRNSFIWKQWGLSVNILYKFGYVFRRNSVNYTALFQGQSPGSADYDHRWKQPGDEKSTQVPSIYFLPDLSRDNFYTFSEALVEKGDQIRLQDLQVSYDLSRTALARLPVQSIRIYCYANNIGLLWKANRQGIDPDFVNSIPNPKTLAVGMKLNF